MIHRLIEMSLRNRGLIIVLYLGLALWGYWALTRTPIDAIPDLSENQVIVFTDWMGRSPQEVEDQITYPLTVSLQGLPGVRVVRSSSAFGFSMINIIFEDNVDLYFARSRVLERLQLLSKSLPPGTVPTLGPDATGVGHVFWYTVEGKGHSLRDLRSLQDWFIRYQLNSVPGVAEVASIGGTVRQYQIDVEPTRLRAYKIPLSAVVDAVLRSNRNVGGNVVEASGSWSVVRGLGLIENVRDVEDIVVGAEGGVPIFIKQVAQVKIGDAFRAAALVKGTHEAVGGVVVARYGVSTVDVIGRVKEKIRALQAGLPPGVRIVSFYDRSTLIERAVDTLKRALIEETIVVTIVNIVFLLHLRSVLIVTIPLPLAVFTAFLFMRYLGITSNIMSLAGIAIAIGVLVDAAIVVTENAFRFIERHRVDPRDRGRARGDAARGAPDLLLDGHHHPRLRPGVRAHRPGGQALPSARVHEDVLDGWRRPPVRDAGPGAVQRAHRGSDPSRGVEPDHAPAGMGVPPGARPGTPAARVDPRRRGARRGRGGRARSKDRQRVHAPAERGRPHVHAG